MKDDELAKADTVVPSSDSEEFAETTLGEHGWRGRPIVTNPDGQPLVTSPDEAPTTFEGPADPLLAMQRFHGHIRQAMKSLQLLTEGGSDGTVEAVPRGIIDFFLGPFVWHDVDEEASLLPRLRRRKHSRHLDEMVEAVTRQHEEIESLLERLLPELEKVRDDVTCDMVTLGGYTRALIELLDAHLHLEEKEIFPFARLLFDDAELESLDRELRHRAASRASGQKGARKL